MKLEFYILKLLAAEGDGTPNESYLFNTANIDLPQAVAMSEIRTVLKSLEAQGHVVSIRDPDRGTKTSPFVYQITTAGKARAAK